MRGHALLHLLIPVVALAACAPDESPTGPVAGTVTSAAGTSGLRVVNSPADPGDGTCNATQCTLREAISDPSTTGITFAPGLTGPITLAAPTAGGGSLRIDRALTITGPSAGIVIRRRNTDPAFRIVRIGTGVAVVLSNLTLRNGRTDGPGGGVLNYGTLTLVRCNVSDNTALHGGGIDNHGELTVTNGTIARNSGQGAAGIDNHDGMRLTVRNSTVVNNSGNGIRNYGGTLILENTTVASSSGRGLSATRGVSTVTNARVVDNADGGIALYKGAFTLIKSTIARNSAVDGGGILNSGGQFTIRKTTISGNSATGRGGGAFNTTGDPFARGSAQLTLGNVTVSGNQAAAGGGLANVDDLGGAHLTITSSTIAANSALERGGGILQEDPAREPDNSNPLSLTNSLIATNRAPTGPDVLTGELGAFAKFSLIGNGSGSGFTNTAGNQVGNVSPYTSPIDPLLGPLATNGGPTRTQALLIGSSALDAAAAADCPQRDQRDVVRPQGAGCDIGSFEREGSAGR